MDYLDVINELIAWKKESLCNMVEVLMEKGKLDITDINLCHTRALENKIAEKDEIIHDADNCIFESIFCDITKRHEDANMIKRKLDWMDKLGTHNMDGIMQSYRDANTKAL